jgi:hypothetical protein
VPILSLAIFFTLNAMLASGWGIYREIVRKADWISILNITNVFLS